MIDLNVLFVGSMGIGRTSLIRSIVYGVPSNDRNSPVDTKSVDESGTLEKHIMQSWRDGDEEFTLTLIDSVCDGDKGDEVVLSLKARDADLIVACYDLKDLSTLDALRDYYLPLIQTQQQHSVVLCVGTKHDLLKDDASFSYSVLRDKLQSLRSEYPCVEAAFFCSTTYTDQESSPFTVSLLKRQIELHVSYPLSILYSNGTITDATKQSLYRIFFSLDTNRQGILSDAALQQLRDICGIELKTDGEPVKLSRYFQFLEVLLQRGRSGPVITLLKAFRVKFYRKKGSKGKKGVALQQVVPLHIIHRTPPVLKLSWFSSHSISRYILFHNHSVGFTEDATCFLQYLYRTWTRDASNESIHRLIAISRDESEIQSWKSFPLVGQVDCDKVDRFFPLALPASTSTSDNASRGQGFGSTVAKDEDDPFLLEDSTAFADTSLTQEGVEVNSFETHSPFAVSYFHHQINGNGHSDGGSEQIWLQHWHMLLCTRGPSYVQELLYRMGYSTRSNLQRRMFPLFGTLFTYSNSDDTYGLTLVPKMGGDKKHTMSSKFHVCVLGNKCMDSFLWKLIESNSTSNESEQLKIGDASSYQAMRQTTGKRLLSTTVSHSNRELVVSAVGSALSSKYCYNMLSFNPNMCILIFEAGNQLQYRYCVHQDTEVLPEYVSRVFVMIRTLAASRGRDTDKEVKSMQQDLEEDCEDYLVSRGLPALLIIDTPIGIDDTTTTTTTTTTNDNGGRENTYQKILSEILQHSLFVSKADGGRTHGSVLKQRIAIALEVSKTVTPLLLSAVLLTFTLNRLFFRSK